MSSPPPPWFGSIAGAVPNNNIAHSSPSSSSSSSSSPISKLSPSIIVIILILSITVFITSSLCLLLRLLHRRRSRSHSPTTATTTTSNSASTRRVSPETLNPSLTSSLPLFTFSSVTRRTSSSTAADSDCAVCLSKFEPQDQLRLLPLCCHAFHAHCIDTWLQSNDTCPLCRSAIHVSESDVLKSLLASSATSGDSFRLEIGSISRRRQPAHDSFPGDSRRSYSIGSFEYVVEDESEITFGPGHRRGESESKNEVYGAPVSQPPSEPNLADEVASGRSWLREYVDRLSVSLSSRTLSFRGSGRFFTGSSRRSEVAGVGECDLEANRAGEEITELFRWFSGV